MFLFFIDRVKFLTSTLFLFSLVGMVEMVAKEDLQGPVGKERKGQL